MQSLQKNFIQIAAFGKYKFWIKFECVFFLILDVFLYLGSVRSKMLEVSYSLVDRVLLFLVFDIPKEFYSH